MQQSSDELKALVVRTFKSVGTQRHYIHVIERLESANLPIIFSLQHLADLIGVESEFLGAMTRLGGEFYRTFEIAKRDGGVRQISAPLPSLAFVQQWISCNIAERLPINQSIAVAYRKGRSIKDHVFPHRGQPALLKTDIKDFFPSIGRSRIAELLIDSGYPGKVAAELSFLVTLNQKLPQGAPSSPAFSNAVCKRLDDALAIIAAERNLICTRYADDIAISGDNVDELVGILTEVLGDCGFQINLGKTRVYGNGMHGRFLTGLVINGDQVRVPRESRRRIRQAVHYFKTYFPDDLKSGFNVRLDRMGRKLPQLDPLSFEKLKGRLLFWRWVEPNNPYPEAALRELNSIIASLSMDNS